MRVSRGITQDAEFEELGRRGYIGNLNDRQYKLLGNIGLRGALTDRIGSSGISAYALAAVDNKLPPLVMDMKEEDYFSNNTIGSFSEVVEHSRAGNATMIDSDGLLKWAPHNLALNSASPATQSITVISGADYTVECTGVSIALSGAGTGTVTEGNPVTVTASTTTLTLTVTGSTGTMWAYRSDLGGMVNNPDRGDSYVPTTSSAVYLPRRGHHVYNGSQWVNKGLLHESESRTNLETESQDYSAFQILNVGSRDVDAVGPDGQTSATTVVANSAGGTSNITIYSGDYTVSTSTAYTFSAFLKAGTLDWVALYTINFTTPATGATFFDLANGVVGTVGTGHTATIQDVGNGWYRCSITFTTDAADTSGQCRIYLADGDGDPIVPLDGSSSILVYGLQLEAGSTPSSYIPTSGSTATRAAETLTIPAANLPWSDTALSFQMEGLVTYADDGLSEQASFIRWRASASDYINIKLDTSSTDIGQIYFQQLASGVNDPVLSASDTYSPDILVPFNISSRHGSTFINGAVDGVALTANTTPVALPDLSTTDLSLGYNFMGTIKTFRMWADDIGDTGIEEATEPSTEATLFLSFDGFDHTSYIDFDWSE